MGFASRECGSKAGKGSDEGRYLWRARYKQTNLCFFDKANILMNCIKFHIECATGPRPGRENENLQSIVN